MTDPLFNAACAAVVRPSGQRGGVLRLVTSADVDSLDPARTYYVWSWLLQRTMQRTVMAFAASPGPAGLRVVPDLAVAPGSTPDGGLTWHYTLRRGVRFEDGTPVTAHQVKYAVERVFAQDVLPGGPTYLIGLLDDPADPYPGPYRDARPGRPGLRAVETPDPYTLVFRLRRPFADFDYLMAQPTSAPVPPGADTGAGYERRPLASGPYRIGEYRPGRRLRLVRNPAWDRSTDPVRSALPDEIDVTVGLTPHEVDARVLAGEFDINLEGRGVQLESQRRIAADPALLARSDNPVTNFLQYISIQPQVPPFDDVHCRRAVHYAADRVALLEARGGGVFGGDLAAGLLPPGLPGHRPYDRYPAGPDGRGDLARARAELAAAGLPDGFETVVATQRGKFRVVADVLAHSLARVGIRARVAELDIAGYYRTGLGLPATVRERGLGLAVTDWGPDYPTEYGFLAPLVDGRLIKPGGGNHNFAELDDPRVNALIDAAQSAGTAQERAGLWAEVDRAVMEHAVILPMVYDRTLHVRNPGVTNVYVHPAFGLYDIQAMGVAR
ncbi:peptide ABC transporter substrate-binding protein [Kitasatospora herbaricolor]|uniref:ABC transporter substrate-binding protein n=1 Tax=Kitasatospora herbaricolor TaxID=68217 RepID=UPI00174C2437|nr:ABC transporter substrate-binding protein [Kitasatospora herbaricolor]MDQ0309526.1 peptide/nickel transport system substrate-binding protein [Kitasatospora herbaricolor]GGV01270.1 peptide ABC transporter substrate-binding protein [Kitasatospora herbaricolor]